MPKVSVECLDRWLLCMSGIRPEFCLLRNSNCGVTWNRFPVQKFFLIDSSASHWWTLTTWTCICASPNYCKVMKAKASQLIP